MLSEAQKQFINDQVSQSLNWLSQSKDIAQAQYAIDEFKKVILLTPLDRAKQKDKLESLIQSMSTGSATMQCQKRIKENELHTLNQHMNFISLHSQPILFTGIEKQDENNPITIGDIRAHLEEFCNNRIDERAQTLNTTAENLGWDKDCLPNSVKDKKDGNIKLTNTEVLGSWCNNAPQFWEIPTPLIELMQHFDIAVNRITMIYGDKLSYRSYQFVLLLSYELRIEDNINLKCFIMLTKNPEIMQLIKDGTVEQFYALYNIGKQYEDKNRRTPGYISNTYQEKVNQLPGIMELLKTKIISLNDFFNPSKSKDIANKIAEHTNANLIALKEELTSIVGDIEITATILALSTEKLNALKNRLKNSIAQQSVENRDITLDDLAVFDDASYNKLLERYTAFKLLIYEGLELKIVDFLKLHSNQYSRSELLLTNRSAQILNLLKDGVINLKEHIIPLYDGQYEKIKRNLTDDKEQELRDLFQKKETALQEHGEGSAEFDGAQDSFYDSFYDYSEKQPTSLTGSNSQVVNALESGRE